MVGLAARWVLTLVFVVAGLSKLLADSRQDRRLAIDNYGVLPQRMVWPAALALPWCEVTIGVLLAAGVAVSAVAALATVLLCAFAGAIGWQLRRGRRFDCGCGGVETPIGWPLVWRNLGLVALAIAAGLTPVGLAVWPGWGVRTALTPASQLIPVPLLVVLAVMVGRLRLHSRTDSPAASSPIGGR